MILFAGLAGAAGLAALALVPRATRPIATALALAGLLGLAAVVATLPTGFEALVGDVPVPVSPYARLWVLATCLASAALVVLAGVARVAPSAAPVGVFVVVLCAAALFAPGGAAAILLATGAGVAAAALAGSHSLRPRVDAVRAAAAAGLIAAGGAALATGPARAAAVALALGGAGIVVASALRLGVAPLHRSGVRVSDATALALAPLVVGFAPAAFVVAADSLSAVATPGSSPEAAWLAMGIRAVAAAGVALAAAGLLLQTSLERALPYAFAAEAAFVLLAFVSASDPAVAAALRTRLLVMPLAAAAAWSAVAALRLDPSRARDGLRGWARRAPALALTLVAAALALFGWPGSPAWEARATIATEAFGPVPGAVALVASATPTVFALVRALVVGTRAAERRPEHGPRLRQARRRETWRIPLGATCALALAVLAIAIAAGAGDVAGAAAASVAVR